MTSDITFTDGTTPLLNNLTHVASIALAEAQMGLASSETIVLEMESVLSINLTECKDMIYLCFFITSHPTASYKEADLTDNALCMDVTAIKMCDPGRKIDRNFT